MKTFYSAEDIEALAERGVTELVVDEDTVLTQLARDTAGRVGVALVYGSKGSYTPTGSATPQTARPVGLKPRGCQHGPLTGSVSGGTRGAASTDSTVAELIGLVKQIADKDRGAKV